MISNSIRITMNCRLPLKNLLAPKHFHLLSCLIFILLLPQLAKCIDRRTSSQEHHRTITTNSHINQPADSSSTSDQQPASSHGSSSSSSPSVAASSASSSSSALPTEDSYDQSDEHNDSLYQRPYDLDLVRLNDTSVVLKWDLPFSGENNNAADHLQFFKIQYKSTKKDTDWKTENREIPATTRAHQINGLRPGNYFFIVSAVYDNDDNVPSESAKYRLRARSKIPHSEMPEQKAPIIHWSNATSEYIRFKWTYKVKDKDMQTFGYLVYYRSAHAVSDFTIYNTLDENVEIVDLEPDTPYEAKVVAYNNVGVSEFSDIIRIKTKPKSNSTDSQATENVNNGAANTLPPATTTREPQTSVDEKNLLDTDLKELSNHHHKQEPTPSLGGSPVGLGSRFVSTNINSTVPTKSTSTSPTTSTKPHLLLEGNNGTTSISSIITTTSSFSSARKFILQISDLLFGENQNDTTLAIRLTLIVLLPIVLIVSGLICLIVCCNQKRRKDSPASSTADSMQLDLEINSYFKNSFPGIEKEYSSSMAPQTNVNHRNAANHGFVNNHPHINDFA